MIDEITHVTVLVEDVDEAIAWYTETMGLNKRADEDMGPGMRWVTVAPPAGTTELVLQEPTEAGFGAEQAAAMRDRIGEGTTTVLGVSDCQGTVAELADRGVHVVSEPEDVPWGVSAIVADLYGNPYNLVETH